MLHYEWTHSSVSMFLCIILGRLRYSWTIRARERWEDFLHYMYIILTGTLTAFYGHFAVPDRLILSLNTPTTSGKRSQDIPKRIPWTCLRQNAAVVSRLLSKLAFNTHALMPRQYLPAFPYQWYYCIEYWNTAAKAGKPKTTNHVRASSLAFIFVYSHDTTQLHNTPTSTVTYSHPAPILIYNSWCFTTNGLILPSRCSY